MRGLELGAPKGLLNDALQEGLVVPLEDIGNEQEHDFNLPRADALLESLRATGYSLRDAIADLIDNCLTAGTSR